MPTFPAFLADFGLVRSLRSIIVTIAGRHRCSRDRKYRRPRPRRHASPSVTRRIGEPEQLRELVELPCGEFLRIHPTEPDHIPSIQRDGPFVANV